MPRVRLILVVLVPIALASSVAFSASSYTPSNASKQSGYNGEGTIAVNPTDPTKVFAGFNNSDTLSQWARSTDGGATWSPAGTGIGATGESCCDNVTEWDSFGNLYLVNLTAAADVVPLYLSTDNGANFSLLKTISNTGSLDQPSIKAGPGSVWVTWWQNGTIMARGVPVTGPGTFGSWTAAQTAPGSDVLGGQFGDIAVGPSGQVVVTWQTAQDDPTLCPCAIYVNTDANGTAANGFGAAVKVGDVNVPKWDSIAPQMNRTIDSEANLAYDLSSGPNRGRLYLVYTDAPSDTSSDTDIYLRHSDDNGATWSAPLKVNDDTTSTSQFFPVVTVDPTSGGVFVSFLDARNDMKKSVKTEYWGAVSTDGGVTFGPNVRLSRGQSSAETQSDHDNEYGDYSGNDVYDGVGYAIWPDDSNSTGDNPDGTNEFDMYAGRLYTGETCFGAIPTIVDPNGDGDGTINGTPGNDVILGEGGNDTIDGGGGNDKICGGDGNDTFLEGTLPNGADMISGGDGTDTVDYGSRTGKLTITLDNKPKSGEKENDAIGADVENATGGAGDDKITGNDLPNVLVGGPGKDKLTGGNGSDTLDGVDGIEGNDTLDGSKEKPLPVADTCTADTTTSTPDKIKNCS